MPDKEEDLVDSLLNLPDHLLQYTLSAADTFGQKCDELSLSLRDNLSHAQWLPPSVRPSPPPSLQRSPDIFLPLPRGSYSRRLYDLISENRGLAVALATFFGTGSLLYYRERKVYMLKRRVRRGPDSMKTEVVVIAGSPASAVPHSIAIDLERRGFIVYITSSAREEELVRREQKKDLVPIHLNIDDPFDTSNTIQSFIGSLETSSQHLRLAGLVVIPDVETPPSPIEAAAAESWSESINTKLLHNISLIQAFIRPLIASKGRVLVLTPTITSSLNLPFHGLESTSVSALQSFASSLNVELQNTGVGVCNIRLGNLNVDARGKTALVRDVNSELLSWRKEIRDTYGSALMSLSGGTNSRIRGSPVRELHNAVFDIITDETQPWPIKRVGRGSLVYPLFGRILPRGFIGWLVGL